MSESRSKKREFFSCFKTQPLKLCLCITAARIVLVLKFSVLQRVLDLFKLQTHGERTYDCSKRLALETAANGKDVLPLGTATSIIWILSERTTVNWQTNLVGNAWIISILNHEIVLRPILFLVYTVQLYAIQLRDVSVAKRQGPVHPDAQLKFRDLFFVLFVFVPNYLTTNSI